ncbi:hypothetical protein [Faecalibacillus intestinalis]|uniref:hypothetical protein n=1 Tax=Faecalibacillus intestinalis TaxID=1982626 RepID=UPI003990A3DD
MEELNELEQQEMEVETTEEPIDEYGIEEVGLNDLHEPVDVESNDEGTEISKATVALEISAGVAIGAGLYRGFKYLKNKCGDKEIKKPTFRKRLRLVTVDENGNIVDQNNSENLEDE